MSSFTTQLKVSPVEGISDNFFLLESFRYHIGELASKEIIEVPAGYITDGASIPQVLQNILSPWGQYGKAAVLHDYLYYTGILETREASDSLMREAMEVLKVPNWQIKIIYKGLRVGGWVAWNNYRKKDKDRIHKEGMVLYERLPLNRIRLNKAIPTCGL